MATGGFVPDEVSFIVSSDPDNGAVNTSPDGSSFSVQLEGQGLHIPSDAQNATLSVDQASIWNSVHNVTAGKNDQLQVRGPKADPLPPGTAFTSPYNSPDTDNTDQLNKTLIIPPGLYSFAELNDTIQRLLENDGFRTMDGTTKKPVIELTADTATQKVIIKLNYLTSKVTFPTTASIGNIMGFNAGQVIGPSSPVPHSETAPHLATFNTVNYFLIHSDLVTEGIRVNNRFTQTIAQVQIDVSPNSQINFKPFNPAKCSADELAGVRRTVLRFWLTDDKNRLVDTGGEYWSARITIRYLRPMVIAHGQ